MRKSGGFRISVVLTLVLIVLALSSPLSATAAPKKTEWKMAVTTPPGHYMAKRYVLPFVNKVLEDSGGLLDIKVFYLGQLPYSGADYLRVVKQRGLDAALTGVKDVVGDVSVTGVFNLPFFFANVEEVQAVSRALRPIFDREFAKYNAKIIYYAEAQTIQIMTKKSPLQSVEGFKGLKLRVLGPEPADALKALGASPVSVSLGELYTSLQRGVIDGAMTNEGSALGTKLYEVCKYFSVLNFQEFNTLTFVNLDSFNALPENLQKIVMDAASWIEAINFAAIRKETDQDRVTLKEKGVEIVQMPVDELTEIQKQVAFVNGKWVAKGPIHKEVYDATLEVMKHLR